MDTFDVKCCQRKLAEHYQKTAKVPTTVWSSVFQVDLEQIYTRLSWVKEEQTRAGSSQKELSHYGELFTEKTKNSAVPKRILVQGETGIGKTTFVKRLLVDWSNLQEAKTEEAKEREDAMKKFNDDDGTFSKEDEDVIEGTEDLSTDDEDMDEHRKDGGNFEEAKMDEVRKAALRKFELVVSVSLKEVSKCQTLRDIMSHSRLFPEEDEKSIDELLSYIRNNQEKVLVVLDGYDEYRTGSEAEEQYGSRSNSPVFKMFHGDILRDCTVLVTTRSSRADEIRGPADIQAEITGFNESDRKNFMRKLLDDQTQVDGLVNFLRKSKMEDLARVPLLSLFFCLLWKEEKEKLMELTESKTKLFRAIMKHILQHSHRKHSASHVSRLREENYKEILADIGKVALEGLLKGDLMFEFYQLPEKVRSKESIIVGLLQLSEHGPSLEPMEMVSFIHKSIQEYLAAWYITYSCVPEGNLGGIEQRASTLEDCQDLENVFQFICGLSDDGAVKVFQHLTSVRISDPTLDLSKTIPDVDETDVPLCDVTSRHWRFSELVYDCFREVRSKAELLTHFLECTGRIILVGRGRLNSELLPKVSVWTELAQTCAFHFSFISFNAHSGDPTMFKALEYFNCLQMPLTIPESSKVLTVDDLVRARKNTQIGNLRCFFNPLLYFRNGQFQVFITQLFFQCDGHAKLFTKSSTDSVPSVPASWCSEQSCLRFLTSLHCYNLSGQTVKAFGAVIRNCKLLNRIELQKSDDAVCDLLEQVPNPSKCSLTIGTCDRRPDAHVHLTTTGAGQLARLLPRFNKTINLGLDLNDCRSSSLDTLATLVASISHKALERLVLVGISLTPTAAAALGQSLPEMLSLQVLELTGVDESILTAKEMGKLFGGFNETLPLYKLTFSNFSVRGCLAPLTKSFRFFPSLKELELKKLNMDEHDQCGLLESFRFISNLTAVSIRGKQQGDAHCYTTNSNTSGVHKRLNLEGISLTPAAAVALSRSLPEMSSLLELELTGVDGSILPTEEIGVLFGGLHKRLRKLSFNGFSMRGCPTPLIKSLCFFPDLRNLELERLNMDEHDQCSLLESLRLIPFITALSLESKPLGQAKCCAAVLTLTSASLTDRGMRLELKGISLTPTAAAALGQSIPEMSSLKSLTLTAAQNGSILQAEELVSLFGGFKRTLPLFEFSFCHFNVKGSIAPLTNSFRFFPNLKFLSLGGFNLDEHNLCCLLDSLQFVPNLMELIAHGEPQDDSHCCTAEENTVGGFTHKALKVLLLCGISLTPAAAAALGRSLSGMLALEDLSLDGVHGSIWHVEEMEALFGGFNKTLPLERLTVSGFCVGSCFALLTKSFRFFPNLRVLSFGGFDGEFNVNEETLGVKGIPLSQAHCCKAELSAIASVKHKTLEQLHLHGISLTPAVAAVLGLSLPEMSSLQELELIGRDGSTLQAEEMEALFGRFNKTLPLYKLTFRGFGVRGCLAPLIKSFRFFPNLRELQLEKLNMDEHDQCGLLESFRFIPNLRSLCVRAEHHGHVHWAGHHDHVRCYTTESRDAYSSFSHRVRDKLNVDVISLTQAVAVALGRSLPEMSSLEELELIGVGNSILQAKEMEALFGGVNKTMPLYRLTFSGFGVRGSLAPLTKSFRFFPNLRELQLEKLNLDEHDQCGLLESFRFIPNLRSLCVRAEHHGHVHWAGHHDHVRCYTTESHDRDSSFSHRVRYKLNVDGISLTPTVAAALGRSLPEMSSLEELELIGMDNSILQAKEMEALFGGVNKTMPLSKFTFSGFSLRGCLVPLTKSFRFFPNLRELRLEKLNMEQYEHDQCGLLEKFGFIRDDLTALSVLENHLDSFSLYYHTREIDTVRNPTTFPRRVQRDLHVDGISLTPAVVTMLGRSLPEMPFLRKLVVSGVEKSILQAEEMEVLFGGFNKTLPLDILIFKGFNVRGCLAPLTKSFRFFRNLKYLHLRKLNMADVDLCSLFDSFQYIPDLQDLNLSFNPLGHAVRSIVPYVSNLRELRYLSIHQTCCSKEDFNYVRDLVQQALPELIIHEDTM